MDVELDMVTERFCGAIDGAEKKLNLNPDIISDLLLCKINEIKLYIFPTIYEMLLHS